MSELYIPDPSITPAAKANDFRYWVQKVLPTVYDDSLSYYELLTKVVDQLNNIITITNQNTDNVNTLDSYVTNTKNTLVDAYNTLHGYVENYFTNLDVQNEINHKLDIMATDGTLSAIVGEPVTQATDAWLAENITNPSNPPLDASLTLTEAAAQAKATGMLFTAVRGQIRESLVSEEKTFTSTWHQGTLNISDGSVDGSSTTRVHTSLSLTFSTAAPVELNFTIPTGWKLGYREYYSDGTYTGNYGGSTFFEGSLTVLKIAGHKYGFVLAKTDNSTIAPSDIPAGLITYVQYVYTDTTLTKANKSADAKITGDMINSTNNLVDIVRDQIKNGAVASEHVWATAWHQGTYNISDGSAQPSNSRVRSVNTLTFSSAAPIELIFTIPSGWKMGYREFYSDGTYTGNYGGETWFESSMSILKIVGHKYATVLAKTDDSAITPSDIPSELITYVQYAYTDTTLTLENKSADAKTVGDAINAQKLLTDMSIKAIAQYPTTFSGWIQGSIDTDGSNLQSSRKVRTAGFENYDGANYVYITIPEGLKLKGREYTSNVGSQQVTSFVGSVPTDNSWCTNQLLFIPTEGHYYRFMAGYTDDDVIAPTAEILEGVKVYIATTQMQNNITQSYAEGSLLGNICIRGAKITNFSDGTPPVIQWYLLMDVDNNFYRSKDLISKEFLFKFTPPSAEVRDWSNGIDAYNNIFFFKDAAAYENENGGNPRLDDAKRVNPVYFMASDNYSSMHELDFGDNFKPAGFIPNGWCVLPNNDIVMCEYTRGTLKTANVWHVSGADATNPSNWMRTWSHDIEDTLDIGTGMKHCHFVNYDFYYNVVYFGTGDSNNGSWIYHSTDNGATWTMTYGPDRRTCRLINLIFTPDKIYSASDDNYYKSFFISDRDANHILDLANAVSIDLNSGRSADFLARRQACYGCVYLEKLGLILMLDRCDNTNPSPVTISGYDIENEEIVDLITLPPVTGSAVGHVGFKCKHFDAYPTENVVNTGFSPKPRSTNPDTNTIGVCGNHGGTTGRGTTRINNLQLHIYKPTDGKFKMRVTTLYI